MKITWIKSSKDTKSFKFFELLGADVYRVNDLEKVDDKINELVKNDYTTIVLTNEVAGCSESIIKKYRKDSNVKIIIAVEK